MCLIIGSIYCRLLCHLLQLFKTAIYYIRYGNTVYCVVSYGYIHCTGKLIVWEAKLPAGSPVSKWESWNLSPGLIWC